MNWNILVEELRLNGLYDDGQMNAKLKDNVVEVTGGQIDNLVITDEPIYVGMGRLFQKNILAVQYIFNDVAIVNENDQHDNVGVFVHLGGDDDNYKDITVILNNVSFAPFLEASGSSRKDGKVKIIINGNSNPSNVSLNGATNISCDNMIIENNGTLCTEYVYTTGYTKLINNGYIDCEYTNINGGMIVNNSQYNSGYFDLNHLGLITALYNFGDINITNGAININGCFGDTVERFYLENTGQINYLDDSIAALIVCKNSELYVPGFIFFNSDSEAKAWAERIIHTDKTIYGTELYAPVFNLETGTIVKEKIITDIHEDKD